MKTPISNSEWISTVSQEMGKEMILALFVMQVAASSGKGLFGINLAKLKVWVRNAFYFFFFFIILAKKNGGNSFKWNWNPYRSDMMILCLRGN